MAKKTFETNTGNAAVQTKQSEQSGASSGVDSVKAQSKKKEDLTTLIPVKGISNATKKLLCSKCGIYDIAGLLTQGGNTGATPHYCGKIGS